MTILTVKFVISEIVWHLESISSEYLPELLLIESSFSPDYCSEPTKLDYTNWW